MFPVEFSLTCLFRLMDLLLTKNTEFLKSPIQYKVSPDVTISKTSTKKANF